MTKANPINLILLAGIILMLNAKIYSQTNNSKTKTTMVKIQTNNSEQFFIDKFFVPKDSRQEFYERAKINRDFIKALPGFIEDAVYERTDEKGDFIILTVANWQSEEAINNAKQAVQAEYKREGFDMQEMIKRLNITIDRGVYKKTNNSKTKAALDKIQTNNSEQFFIDKFFVPKDSRQEFYERAKINRDFIKALPGFIEDAVYERTDEKGDFIILTVANWQSEEAINNAKQAVQAKYKSEGFDMQGMINRLNITIDRGVYKKTDN